MIKTKRVYINAISILIVVSLFFIYNLPLEKALSSSASPVLNASQPTTTNITSGSTNATNATGALSENITSSLGNATVALENATAGLANATKALQDISNISAAPPLTTTATTATNATAINTTKVINAIFDSNLPIVFILVIFGIIIIPLSLDMWLAYHRKPTVSSSSTDKENVRALGMPGLYRSLMTFGVIVLVGTVIFYLLALITLNIDNSTNPVLQSLVDILKNLGTILGTALATIVAFYFGVRGSESATEKAAAATERAAAAATSATQKASAAATKAADEKAPSPKVLDTIPADGATDVPLASLISATFSEQMSGPTINENTFTVRKEGLMPNLIKGNVSLSPDGKTAIFDSEPDLDPNTKYTAEINEGAKDVAGNALVSGKRWSFITTSKNQ
jgi:Bacterial Ig-like domain